MPLPDPTDLAEFIAHHARPYDPATDTYRRAPFAQPVKAGKNSPIYNAHSYHTKVPPEGIVPYIEHYTDPGDLVLDPFCGSGMTGVAALMTGRHAILNDLSPAAVHIASNFCRTVDVAALKREFERIKAAVKEEFDWLYGTTCDRCGGPATIQYTIWSEVFECARCNGEIVLWNSAVDQDTGKVAEQFPCPTCGAAWRKTQVRRLRSAPVVTNYACPRCRPSHAEHFATESERQLVEGIEHRVVPYWYPTDQVDSTSEMYIRCNLGYKGVKTADGFFTRRNLWALARLWHEFKQVTDLSIRAKLEFTFTGAIVSSTVMVKYVADRGGRSNLPGTLYVPSLSLEQNVGRVIERRFDRVVKGIEQLSGSVHTEHRACTWRVGSATDLAPITDSSVDYVFTDPPFGMNLYYADLNFPWEAWLRDFTDPTEEAVVNREKKINSKTITDYARLMTDSFCEVCRVLKPGRWASVVFHNSDDRIWQVILDAAESAGLEMAEINAFDKVQLSYKGARGQKGLERVTNQDIVLNLRKPHVGQVLQSNDRTHLAEAEQRVVETAADFLATDPAPGQRTLQHLWNHVLYDLLRQGSVEVSMADVERMLTYHSQTFKLVDGRYYLRGQAVLEGNVFDLRSDAGAIAWLDAVLSEPQTTGELIPRWQQETASLGGVDPGRLDRLLEQNFWQDKRSGRWRRPTPAEREQMSARADLGAQAFLRAVRRFLDGEVDRHPNDRELCLWVRHCYKLEFYAEAVALMAHVHEDRVDPQEIRELKRIVAVCRMRAGQGKG